MAVKRYNGTNWEVKAGDQNITYNATAPTAPSVGDIWVSTTDVFGSDAHAGIISAFAGSSAPTGYLLCDGTAVSRTTYATLFAVISTTYGSGDGSTTFNVPDLRTKVAVGKNATGTFATLGGTGGVETVTLTEAQMPSHVHSVDPPSTNFTSGNGSADHQHSGTTNAMNQNAAHGHTWSGQNSSLNNNGQSGNYPFKIAQDLQTQWTGTTGNIDQTNTDHLHGFTTGSSGSAHTHTTTVDIAAFNSVSAGSGNAHNNLQPYIVLNYIIKV
jgi:microcystin-dependent protein